MVTNCPIYHNKTVLCNLASLLLCIHQYIRSKKSSTESKPGWQRDLELTEGWSTGTLGTRTWRVQHPFVLLTVQKGMTDPALRSSWTCCTDKSPLRLANPSIAQTWHWWLYTCTPLICTILNVTGLQLDAGSCGLQSPTTCRKPACPSLPAGPAAGRSSSCPQAVPTLSRSQAEPWAVPVPAAAPGARVNKKWWRVSCAFLHSCVMAQLYIKTAMAVYKIQRCLFLSGMQAAQAL